MRLCLAKLFLKLIVCLTVATEVAPHWKQAKYAHPLQDGAVATTAVHDKWALQSQFITVPTCNKRAKEGNASASVKHTLQCKQCSQVLSFLCVKLNVAMQPVKVSKYMFSGLWLRHQCLNQTFLVAQIILFIIFRKPHIGHWQYGQCAQA